MRTEKPAKKRRICTVRFYEDLMVCIKPNTNYKYNYIRNLKISNSST